MLFHHEMILVAFRVLYTYAPFGDQPKLDRTLDEIPEVSEASLIYFMYNILIYVCAHVILLCMYMST